MNGGHAAHVLLHGYGGLLMLRFNRFCNRRTTLTRYQEANSTRYRSGTFVRISFATVCPFRKKFKFFFSAVLLSFLNSLVYATVDIRCSWPLATHYYHCLPWYRHWESLSCHSSKIRPDLLLRSETEPWPMSAMFSFCFKRYFIHTRVSSRFCESLVWMEVHTMLDCCRLRWNCF